MSGDHCKIIVDEESGQVSLEDTRLVFLCTSVVVFSLVCEIKSCVLLKALRVNSSNFPSFFCLLLFASVGWGFLDFYGTS